MKLTQEQVQAILDEAKPSIIEGLKEEVTRQAKWEMSPIVAKMIQDEVTTFMSDEIIPVVRQQLIEGREGLISIAISSTNVVAEMLAESIAISLKKKLETSWERTKIFEALFK